MKKPFAVSLNRLAWPKRRDSINGFRDKREVETQMKDLMSGLKALRVWTENITSISFYPEDLVSFKPKRPAWRFSKYYKPESRLKCYAIHGTRLVLRPEADRIDRFDDGPDCGDEDRRFNLFERLILFPDIVDMEFIYDEDYWERRKEREPYAPLEARKFINICVPYTDYEYSPTMENDFQKAWIDKQGCLHILWTKIPFRKASGYNIDGCTKKCFGAWGIG